MDINEFGRRSFITWTIGLKERIKNMSDKEYICLSCSKTFADGDTYCCSDCGNIICPKCGGECEKITIYDEVMRVRERES